MEKLIRVDLLSPKPKKVLAGAANMPSSKRESCPSKKHGNIPL